MLRFTVCLLAATICCAQQSAVSQSMAGGLTTSDTEIVIRAGPEGPILTSIGIPHGLKWKNSQIEQLPRFVESGGKQIPLRWNFVVSDSSNFGKLALIYESESPHLRLTWAWRNREHFGPIEHEISVENLDRNEVWLPLQDSLLFEIEAPGEEALENVYVEKGEGAPSEVGMHRDTIADGYLWIGESSSYASPAPGESREIIPWMLLQQANAQSGFYIGIEFSGRTRLSLARKGKTITGIVGLNPEPGPFRTRLAPGETFRTPTVFVGAFSGGIDAAGNLLRRWERAALLSRDTMKSSSYPLLVNNSWGSGMAVDESLALKMIHDSAELGLEMFHMDAGWFRTPGDWHPDPKKFPHGLAKVADEAHRQGLKFGIWADWAQAGLGKSTGALNIRDPKVRDWLVNDLPVDWKPEEFKGQTVDLGVPSARDWAARETDRIVREYKVDMLEHDGYVVAKGCDRSDHPHGPPVPQNIVLQSLSPWTWTKSSNSTDVSYHAANAYYAIQDKLRREHPGLLLEVCNDGGRMVDFGSAAHADYFSITDAYDPLSNRRAFYDASHVLPPPMLETYVEKWPAQKLQNFLYMLRSGMMGWLTVMQDTNAWTPEQHEAAKSEFQFYKKELRQLIRTADLYHISPRPDGVHWDAIEYFDPLTRRGALYIFRGTTPEENDHTFRLQGLSADAKYQISFRDAPARNSVLTGRELAAGLKVSLSAPLSSEIVLIQEEGK